MASNFFFSNTLEASTPTATAALDFEESATTALNAMLIAITRLSSNMWAQSGVLVQRFIVAAASVASDSVQLLAAACASSACSPLKQFYL